MNNQLRNIIEDFQSKVAEANELLKAHLGIDEPHNRGPEIAQSGVLNGKYKYFFHGIGCAVHISKKEVVDFDYGTNGRIDGFDEWRLCGFFSSRKKKYFNVEEVDIKKWFQEAVGANEIARTAEDKYDTLYYFVQKNES